MGWLGCFRALNGGRGLKFFEKIVSGDGGEGSFRKVVKRANCRV